MRDGPVGRHARLDAPGARVLGRHRTVIFDNRDVGQSSLADGPYEIADMAHDTLALADALELESFHLLGVSMGGAISQEVALAAPERVRTLTLAVTLAGRHRLGAQAERGLGRARAEDLARGARGRADAAQLLRAVLRGRAGRAWVRGMMLQHPHPQPPEAFIRQLEACGRHDARERLSSLACADHVIGAEYDMLVPVWKSRELADLIPDAQLTVLEGAPHGANVERADEFNKRVLDFIAERAPSCRPSRSPSAEWRARRPASRAPARRGRTRRSRARAPPACRPPPPRAAPASGCRAGGPG